jgi:7-cyano-7-deazaguanine reductase
MQKKSKPRKQSSGPNPTLTLLGQSRTAYPDHPDKARLEAFPNAHAGRDYWIAFHCPEFTALCPVTGQPDFGVITIEYVPNRLCLESKSLKLYLFAYRNHGTFHEAAVNRILDDVVRAIQPRRARVTGRFNPRGGLAITVTAEHGMPCS